MSAAILILASLVLAPAPDEPWTPQSSGTKARLRGLSVVSSDVVWASGTGGTYVLTTDGGKHWRSGTVPDAVELDFRDVHGVDARTAYVLSAGDGDKSRIYKTTDGGQSWTLQFRNRGPKGFYDAIAFWDADHGIAMGDPLDGRFAILTTDDGGARWTRLPAEFSPEALANEGGFAASGTCLVTRGKTDVWIGTGGAAQARVLRSVDRGRSWTIAPTPVRAASPSRGIFSLAFSDDRHGIVIGGDYKSPDETNRVVARSEDGGRTWIEGDAKSPGGFRSAIAWRPGTQTAIAVGPTGSDISTDGGKSWTPLGARGFHAVAFAAPDGPAWAVGDDGRIDRLRDDAFKAR
jgi:photosystem II stability/assembly factor-like uncharacterized protein